MKFNHAFILFLDSSSDLDILHSPCSSTTESELEIIPSPTEIKQDAFEIPDAGQIHHHPMSYDCNVGVGLHVPYLNKRKTKMKSIIIVTT